MQAEPPQPQIPTIDLGPVPLIPIPQEFEVAKGQIGDVSIAILTFRSPLTATAIVLGREAADRLCDEIRAQFIDLEIVRTSNGGGAASQDALRMIRDMNGGL